MIGLSSSSILGFECEVGELLLSFFVEGLDTTGLVGRSLSSSLTPSISLVIGWSGISDEPEVEGSALLVPILVDIGVIGGE